MSSSLAAILASPVSGVSGAVTGYPIGRGDGVSTVFAAPPEITAISAVYRRDWQGNVALSASPRTNLFIQSENLTYFANAYGEPYKTATTITDNSNTILQAAYKTLTVPLDSNQYAATMIVAKNAPNIVCIGWYFVGGDETDMHSVCIDTVTGNFLAYTWTSKNPVQCDVSDLESVGWAVTLYPQNNGTNSSLVCSVFPAWNSTLGTVIPVPNDATLTGSVGITKIMSVPGMGYRTSYIPTTTAPVTVTDYTASGTTLTLAEAPAFAAELTVDGTGVDLPLLQIGG